jgi:hypothetical protein
MFICLIIKVSKIVRCRVAQQITEMLDRTRNISSVLSNNCNRSDNRTQTMQVARRVAQSRLLHRTGQRSSRIDPKLHIVDPWSQQDHPRDLNRTGQHKRQDGTPINFHAPDHPSNGK